MPKDGIDKLESEEPYIKLSDLPPSAQSKDGRLLQPVLLPSPFDFNAFMPETKVTRREATPTPPAMQAMPEERLPRPFKFDYLVPQIAKIELDVHSTSSLVNCYFFNCLSDCYQLHPYQYSEKSIRWPAKVTQIINRPIKNLYSAAYRYGTKANEKRPGDCIDFWCCIGLCCLVKIPACPVQTPFVITAFCAGLVTDLGRSCITRDCSPYQMPNSEKFTDHHAMTQAKEYLQNKDVRNLVFLFNAADSETKDELVCEHGFQLVKAILSHDKTDLTLQDKVQALLYLNERSHLVNMLGEGNRRSEEAIKILISNKSEDSIALLDVFLKITQAKKYLSPENCGAIYQIHQCLFSYYHTHSLSAEQASQKAAILKKYHFIPETQPYRNLYEKLIQYPERKRTIHAALGLFSRNLTDLVSSYDMPLKLKITRRVLDHTTFSEDKDDEIVPQQSLKLR